VELGPERAQRFGVRTEPAERRALVREVRTVGIVRTDETRESHVHVKWAGWVEEFFVSFVGQQVKKGERLFSVYSPDLVTAQQELVLAARRLEAAKASERAGEVATARALVEAARAKLLLWDVPAETVARIEKTREVERAVTVRAPRSGTVIEKHVLPGMYVEPEMDLYVIADLSRVWVLVDLYEYEIPFVRPGQAASFSPVGVDSAAGGTAATVAFVDPTLDPVTRTVKVRLEVPNEAGTLRPGGYGTVALSVPLPEAVLIPADAILDTGERSLVFVRAADGVFAPREVCTGARAQGRVQILTGLDAGEEVVTRAQFILDSESRLRAAAAARPEPRAHGDH
jgi:Cu(I)/Ag(I) efflux system membrane fusion protein